MRCSTKTVLITVLVLACAVAASRAGAEDAPPPSVGGQEQGGSSQASANAFAAFTPAFDVAIASRYLFQGIDYSDGRSTVQPNFSVGYGKFTAVGWWNYQPYIGDVNEFDGSFKYPHAAGPLSLSPGYTYLTYPNRTGWLPSQEPFLDLGLGTRLSPTLSLHYDFYEAAPVVNRCDRSPHCDSPASWCWHAIARSAPRGSSSFYPRPTTVTPGSPAQGEMRGAGAPSIRRLSTAVKELFALPHPDSACGRIPPVAASRLQPAQLAIAVAETVARRG